MHSSYRIHQLLGSVFPKLAASWLHSWKNFKAFCGHEGPQALHSLLQGWCFSCLPHESQMLCTSSPLSRDTLRPQTMLVAWQIIQTDLGGARGYSNHKRYFYMPTHEHFCFVTSYCCKNPVILILGSLLFCNNYSNILSNSVVPLQSAAHQTAVRLCSPLGTIKSSHKTESIQLMD